MHSPARY